MHEWLVTIETEKYVGDADPMEAFERFSELLEASGVEFPSGSVHERAFSATLIVSAEGTEEALHVAARAFTDALLEALGDLPLLARAQVELVEEREPVPA